MWNCKDVTRLLVHPDLRQSITLVVNYGWSSHVQPGGTFTKTALENAKPFRQLPHLTMVPVIGTAWSYLPIIGRYDSTKPHLAMKDKRKMFGDLYRDRLVNLDVVCAFDPIDCRCIRREYKNQSKFSESVKMNGEEWGNLRSKAERHLLSSRIIYGFSNELQDVAKDLVYRIRMKMDSKNEVSNLIGELYKWSLDSVTLLGLGLDTRLGCPRINLSPDSEALQMINSVVTQFNCMNKLEGFMENFPWWKLFRTPFWIKYKEAADIFGDEHPIMEIIKNGRFSVDKPGLIVKIMSVFGMLKTSHAVSFLLYHLARNQDKQEMLYKNIVTLLPNKGDRLTVKLYLSGLQYLDACLRESQRLLPVVGGPIRTIEHDIILSGYRIPAKTLIIIGSSETCIDERYFPDPKVFLPQRWIQKDSRKALYHHFGRSHHKCVGRDLAKFIIAMLMVELIRNFRVEYNYEDIGSMTRFINGPDKTLRFTFIER